MILIVPNLTTRKIVITSVHQIISFFIGPVVDAVVVVPIWVFLFFDWIVYGPSTVR